MSNSTLQSVDSQPKNLTIEVPAMSALELEVGRLRQENALLREDREQLQAEVGRLVDETKFLRRNNDLLASCLDDYRRALKEAQAKKPEQSPWASTPMNGGFTKIS